MILTASALTDLEDVFEYIHDHDSIEAAQHVVTSILDVCDSWLELPNRGAIPTELKRLGVLNYREIFFKPYRILYSVNSQAVEVLLIADGRRDMDVSLMRRLLGD